ncbi:hypothetical protein K470DRAFT_49375 [Piedraia hortae CBS 480.64]|uniref:Cryptic loci regulator 2 N-terminal domain-containing protein n=1 Tax=Piedraia hortae CBS 480.64 TaxID=1314780 RepID=A0A6A7CBV0_9PEZI|nr:hypothetical protein K470DRAFT_49375 [Piedraia hortae CBS 480.64]
MDGMEGMCECIVCQGPKKRPNRPDPQYGWEPRILPIRPFSDGDASKHAHIQLTPNDDWWLRKLASVKWAHDLNLPWVPGGYKLDALPEGYAGFQQIKPGAREKIQHWIIGHPSGAKCKGVEKFWPHFKWLMDGMVGECQCTLCVVKGAKRESETKRKHEASLKGGGGNAVDERNGKYSRMESDGGQVPGTSTVSGGDISSAQMVESGPSMMHVDGNERDEVRYDVPDRMNNNPHQNGSRVDAGYVTPQWTR